MAVIMSGVLMTAVDTTIVVLALPEIQRGLHVTLSAVVWVIISFLLVITLLATQVGRLGDMFGRVRMYETGFGIFILGSLGCALAWNEASIIAFRVVQGIGGAFIMANSGAVIADLYPRELHDRAERSRRRLDLPGMLSLGLGLFGVLWAMTRLATTAFDVTVAGYLAGGLALIALFVVIELRQPEPMLPLSIFRIPTMAASLLAALFQGLASFAVLFLLIMYLQGPRGLSPIHASLLLVPGYVLSAVAGPYGGRLADRRSPVLPATAGLAIQVVSLAIYAQLTVSTGLWVVVLASVINGIGAGFFFPANSSAIMKAAPPEAYGIASRMLRTFSNIGMVVSNASHG